MKLDTTGFRYIYQFCSKFYRIHF